MKRFITMVLLSLLIQTSLSAKVLTTIEDAIQNSFQNSALEIDKKNILLTKKDTHTIQKQAKLKLHSHIIKSYIVKKDAKTIAYGILISRKIRSKNGAVLYLLDNSGKLLNMEVIAFNEPLEYLPNESWKKQFNNVAPDKELELGRNITPITGATLSAKSIIEGARIAQAIYRVKLKEN